VLSQAEFKLGSEAMEVRSTLGRVRLARLALGTKSVPKPTFDLAADMQELEVGGGRLRVRYVISLETYPSVERAEMEGVATVSGRRFGNLKDLKGLGESRLAEMAIEIYRKNYESLYLLLNSMGLEVPSPWLVRDVHLVLGSIGNSETETSPVDHPFAPR